MFYAQPEGSGGQTGRWRAENLPAGDYWLLETRAPDRQISNSGTQIREIPGVQLLAEPISFRVWPLEEGAEAEVPELGEGQPNPAQYGRSQLDITTPGADSVVPRCQPGSTVASRDVACVNPTGYLMLVKDTVPAKLPVTGGVWLRALTVGGGVLLVVAVAAILWRRRTA